MEIKAFFDERTFTLTYVVWDKETKDGVLIDSVLDYEPIGSKVWTESLKQHIDYIQENKINLHYLLETHAHADHISASPLLKKIFPNAKIAIGKYITQVQEVFKEYFQLKDLPIDGSQFDQLLEDEELIRAGSLSIQVIHTPGHTPACVSYLINDNLFTGDAIFMPDYGTGRCDFPKGDSHALYHSITKRIYSLPDETKIYVGHDYLPNGRELKYQTTVGESKKSNIQLPFDRSEEDFVNFRKNRDSGLSAPKLLYQSVMANIGGGGIPHSKSNEKAFFKLPINIKDDYGYIE